VAGVGSSAVLPGDDLLYALAPEAMVRFVQERAAASELDEMFRQTVADESGTIPEEPWRDLGPDRLRELISMLESSSVDELTLENRGTRVTLRKASSPGSVPAGAATSAAPASPGAEVGADAHPDQDETRFIVGASMVGTFYRSPAPGVAPYVEVGSHVSKGEALCVLEAMKLMNELISEVSGEVLAVLAEDGTAVEYGQPLFLIRLETE
jgi:oxaloacetate decarboxylase alpha subunit